MYGAGGVEVVGRGCAEHVEVGRVGRVWGVCALLLGRFEIGKQQIRSAGLQICFEIADASIRHWPSEGRARRAGLQKRKRRREQWTVDSEQ